MYCSCSVNYLSYLLINLKINIIEIRLGYLKVEIDSNDTIEKIENLLKQNNFKVLSKREELTINKIKQTLFELIFKMNNIDSIIKKSEYLVDKLNMSYQSITRLFSKYESITLEKYIILLKIERIKELIDEDELPLSEIAYLMDYNSVQYLSNQFKKETGLTLSEYKNSNGKLRKPIDML